MKKILSIFLVVLMVSFLFSADINLDGYVEVNYDLTFEPKIKSSESIGLLYLGIKGDSYFIGLIREPVNSSFKIDQAYGILNLNFANLFLGKKVQNFRVSPFGNDLWLAGNLSVEFPNNLGSIYAALDMNFDSKSTNKEDQLPKVNVLFANMFYSPISLKTVLYENYKKMETGIDVNLNLLNVLSYAKYNIEENKLEKLTAGLKFNFEQFDLTSYISPDAETFKTYLIGVDGEYKLSDILSINSYFTFDSETPVSKFGISANYNYMDIVVSPSILWDGNKEENQTSGTLSITMYF
ncbi:hypothetical protein [Marinitoga sp. 38H-ov]|uniref:hypothetical protein n=1 Tax=Marinitoga sp. 38H-ov TaxID=1755814 RepID=UPI0013EB9CC9|nr:hypothetical protein [Marinitoga sp. 38H-ov]KAF2956522.1 hypothetical protein AS160_05700 [Marinitoga sp. 38H-ov]